MATSLASLHRMVVELNPPEEASHGFCADKKNTARMAVLPILLEYEP